MTADSADSTIVPPTSLRVLLADDSLVNHYVVARLLARRGHLVTVVTNGTDALAAVGRGSFDVILVDVDLPVVGGFGIAAAVRDREKTTGERVRMVAMIAHLMRGDRERCLSAGMDDCLAKPIDRHDLLSSVEQFGAGANDTEGAPTEAKLAS